MEINKAISSLRSSDRSENIDAWTTVLAYSVTIPCAEWSEDVRKVLIPDVTKTGEFTYIQRKNSNRWARRIPATSIRSALMAQVPSAPQGLTLSNVYIEGQVDLTNVKIAHAINFISCKFDHAPRLEGATIPALSVQGCVLPGIKMSGAHILQNCVLTESHFWASVEAPRLNVGGQFLLSGSRIYRSTDGKAINLQKALLQGGAFMQDLRARGCVYAPYAKVNVQLELSRAVLEAVNQKGEPDRTEEALCLQHSEVVGGLFLNGTRTDGFINAHSIGIDGQLQVDNATIKAKENTSALNFENAKIGGKAFMEEVNVLGYIDFSGILVGEDLRLNGAFVSGGVYGRSSVRKEVRNRASFHAPYCRIEGEMSLFGATLGGAVFEGTPMEVDGEGWAQPDSVNFRQGFVGAALDLEASVLNGRVYGYGLRVEGKLKLDVSRVKNYQCPAVDLRYGDFSILRPVTTRKSVQCVDLSNAKIGTLKMANAENSNMREPALPLLHGCQGWEIGVVEGNMTTSGRRTAQWLDGDLRNCSPAPHNDEHLRKTGESFTAQPWKELARVYDSMGKHSEARWLRRRAGGHTTKAAPWTHKLPRWMYYLGVGYGYYPLWSLRWILAIWGLGFIMTFYWSDNFVPTLKSPPTAVTEISTVTGSSPVEDLKGYTKFEPVLYAAEVALPPATTGQSLAWQPRAPWISWVLTGLKGLSWIFTALLLAGITGFLRKD